MRADEHVMRTMTRCLPLAGLLAGAACWQLDAAATERYRSLGGVTARIDVSYGILNPDLDGENDFDSTLTVEAVYQSRLGMTSYEDFGVVWGFGIAGHTQSLEANNLEADYVGASIRYHLGLTYALNDTWHIQAVPYGGVGYGQIDLSIPFIDLDDQSGSGEFGLQIHALYSNPESFTFGAGISFQGRITDYDFSNPIFPFSVHNEQYYIAANITAGWQF